MAPPLLYLAGPIAGCDYAGATDWREYVRQQLEPHGILVLSPMRGRAFLVKEEKIQGPYDHPLTTAGAITQRDRFDVQRCDAVLANFIGATKISAGTMIEFGWADAWRKPVIVAMEPTGNVHDHPIIKTIAGFVLPTLDEAIEAARCVLATGT